MFRTGQPARIDDYALPGPTADQARAGAIRSVVATPILVEGRRLWGAMTAGATHDEGLPPETEARLGQFTDLMATAIANTESHARADRLSEEQAALRRVATLVAEESSPAEVFARVAEEVAIVLGEVDCALVRGEGISAGNRSAGTSTSTGRSSRATTATTPAWRPPRASTAGWMPCASSCAAPGVALLGVLECLADERLHRPSLSRSARCASFSAMMVCTSRCCPPS